ncbi:MAG: HEAT repeat domain-containing protein [Pirellulaceae bacterium]
MASVGVKRLCYASVAIWLASLAGCADGPVPYLMALNPTMRRQWAADEAYAPTLHRQLAEVEALRGSAKTLSAEQQVHWCGELQHIISTHSNPLLRAACVETLVLFSVPESSEGLRLALQDTDATVRQAACRAWGSRGGQEAMELLAERLGSDSQKDVKLAAARELGRFSDPVAYQALGLALQDGDAALQYRAIESLKQSSRKNFGNNLQAWQQFAQGQDPGPEYSPSLADRVRELF